MTKQEIIDRIESRLDQHARRELGYYREAGYHEYLFGLFAESYRQAQTDPSDCITGDGLLKEISERWLLDDSEENKPKQKLLRDFCLIWSEWQFAWDNYDIPRA